MDIPPKIQEVHNGARKKYIDLIEYYKSRGANCQNLQITEDKSWYIKVVATKKIGLGQIIIQIPETHIITQAKAKNSQQLKMLCEKQNLFKFPKVFLVLYLITQKRKKQKSQLFHYINCLPTIFDTFPLKYSEKQLKYLKETSFLEYLQLNRSIIKSDYSLIETQFGFFSKLNSNYQQFQQMCMIVNSRSFNIQKNRKKLTVLVPIADMFNYCQQKETVWCYNQKTKSFQIRNIVRQIKQNEEIFTPYGNQSNTVLLYGYGFVIPNNPKDTILIALDTFQKKMMKLNVKLGMRTNDLAFSYMISHYRKYLFYQQYPNEQIKQTSQTLSHTSESLKQLLQKYSDTFFGIQIQMEMWSLIKHTMQKKLGKYPTTIEQDQLLLKDKQLEINIQNCIQLRLGQKRVLKYFIDFAENIVKYMKKQQMYNLNQNQHYVIWLKDNIKTYST